MTSGAKPKEPTGLPFSVADLLWVGAYFAILAGTAVSIVRGRDWALKTYDSSQATSEWQEWKDDATAMSKVPNSVKRKPPKSDLPPALVLMRDYFVICFIAGVGLTGVLLAAIMLMLRGAIANQQPFVDRSPPERNPNFRS